MSLGMNEFFRTLPDIALFGKMRSGKDEVAKILKEMGFDVQRVAFGDELREMFHKEYPEIPRVPKPVKGYQEYGQEKRAEYPNVWVDSAIDTMHSYRLKGFKGSFVVTDTRQPNEFETLKSKGFVMVKVEAPEELRVKRMLDNGETVTREILDGETESHIDWFREDFKISNYGDLDELRENVFNLIYKIQERRNV